MSDQSPTYLGIDGTNWVHVLWHAKSGRDVVAALVERAESVCRQLQPAVCVACFDRRSFRHELVDGYKAGRKQKPAELLAALTAAETQLAESFAAFRLADGSLMQWTIAAEDGYEADDGLATLAAAGRAHQAEVILASPDKDLRQCLVGNVKILRSFKMSHGKATQGDWYTAMKLFDDFGLEGRQWADYQALVGDPTDAVIGCEGWGEKTAAAALARCKSLAELFRNPWSAPCTDRQRGALIKFKARAEQVLQLVTLRTDVGVVLDAVR